MKKHILKVWMILAISFLAMNVAGQGPTVVTLSPEDNAPAVDVNTSSFVITFSEEIKFSAGGGNAFLYDGVNYVTSQYLISGNNNTVIDNNSKTLSITFGITLDYEKEYNIVIPSGAIESKNTGVPFAGLSSGQWSFTTEAESLQLTWVTLSPEDNSPAVDINTSSFVITFSEEIKFSAGGGNAILYDGVNYVTSQYLISGNNNTVIDNNSKTLSITFGVTLDYEKEYNIVIPSGAIESNNTGVPFAGLSSGQWSFTTEAEPLEITLMAPVDGATDVPLDQSLVATFNQNIQFSEGGASVSIYSYDDEVLFETLTYEAGLSISGMELTINPTTDFAEGTRYYVIIPGGDIESTTGTPFSGVTLKDDWDFTTQNLAPSVVTYDPDGTSVVAIDKVLTLTFDRLIKFNESGIHTIRIGRNSDASTFYTYYINGLDTDELLSVSGNVLSIIPPVNFESSTQYYVEISDGAILSLADMSFPGISGTTTWTFTSVVAAAPPVIASGGYSPGTGAFEISRNPILELTFNENIVKGNSGYFKIYTSVDNEEVIAIPRTNAQVSILDNKLTVSLSNITLEYGTEYYILIDPGFVKSSTTGVDFGGIELTTEWSFTTESSPPFWVNGYPSITNQTMNDFVFNAWADVEGTYYGVVTQSSTPPTAEQISQGMNQGGTSARIAFNDVVSDVSMASTQTVLFTSETPLGGTYYLHAVYSNGSKFSAIETLTIDRIVPQILSVDPSDGLIVFPVDSPLSISFNEPVVGSDGNALTVAYFSLEKDGEPVEDVNFGFAVETVSEITTVTLKPTLALDPNTAYTLTINPVYDLNGNMGAETLINFQTDGLSTWTGAVSTAWTDPENWLGDSYVPFKSVLIQSGSTLYPEITTGTVDVHNLTIEPGAALTHTGGTLNVTGLFTLKSSVDVNASYIIKGGTPVVDGDKVRVEQVINDVYMTYLISAPTDGTTATNFGGDFPLYLFDNTTDTWPAVPSSHQMQTGFGYRMWTDDPLVYFSGEFNTGGVQVPLSYTSGKGYGWNLVGNPYAASIDWTQLKVIEKSQNIENNFWVWMPTRRAYGAYSASTTIPLNIESSIIPSNHAFLVKVVSPEESAFINFDPAAQVANSGNYLKSGKESATSYVKFAGVSGKVRDEMAVAFIDDASMGLDKYDMEKRFANQNHVLELFTNVGDMQAAINAVPLDGNYEVALGYNAMVAGDFSIEMVKDNTDNVSCILVDKSLEIEQVLRPGDRYEFSAAKGKNITRFALKFSKIVTSERDIERPVADFSCHVFENEIFVDFDNAHNGLKFQVADVQGRILKQGSILDSSKFSVGAYEQGVYVLTLIDLNGQWYGSQKVVVY